MKYDRLPEQVKAQQSWLPLLIYSVDITFELFRVP